MKLTKKERIIMEIKEIKDIEKKATASVFYNKEDFFLSFYDDCVNYIKAIKEGRIICIINSVSSSGMSRNMRFLECAKTKKGYRYYNFISFFKNLGFTTNKNGTIKVRGCGMDMVFATNYDVIHTLHRLGFLNKKQCDELSQATPRSY